MTNTPTAPLDADVTSKERRRIEELCGLLVREGRYSGVWFGDQLLEAASTMRRLASTQGSQGREAEAISTASEGDGLDRLYPEAYRLMLNFYCDRDFYNSDPSCRPADNVLMAIQYTLWSRSPKVASDTATGVDWTIERDSEGEAMVCTGCGTTRTLDHIRYIAPAALSCCPERHMIPVRQALVDAAASPFDSVGGVEG
jgi:hypothetical protein